MVSQRSGEIVKAFTKYLNTGDKALIEGIEEDELREALDQFSLDRGSQFYVVMERHFNELKEQKGVIRTRREKWKDRGIGFILAIIIMLLGLLLSGQWKPW